MKLGSYFVIIVLVCFVGLVLSDNSTAPYICSLQYGTYTTNEPFQGNMQATINSDNAVDRTSYIVQWYQNWGDGSGQWSNVDHFLKIALNFASAGAPNNHIPLLTWQPWGPRFSVSPAEFPLNSIANGAYDSYIQTWANGIASLPYTVYLRPLHEMDGTWYPWGQGVNGNNPSQFIAAWRRIHSVFTARGVKNVKFVWCPNNSNNGIDQRTLYPGDDYVDWIGLDAYASSASGPASFKKIITTNCNPINPYARLTSMTNKPMMIAEFGAQEPPAGSPTSKGQWFQTAAQDIQQSFPRIKAIVYFNDASYRYATSADSIAGAKKAFGGCR